MTSIANTSERASTLKQLRAPNENMGLRVAYTVLLAGFMFYGMQIASSVLVAPALTAGVLMCFRDPIDICRNFQRTKMKFLVF